MAVCGLRILVDFCWYLAFMTPVLRSVPPPASRLLCALPCVWGVWLLFNWKKRDFWKVLPDHFFFEVKFLTALTFLELLVLGTTAWQEQCGFFVAAFFVLGFFLLRVGRLSGTERGKIRFWGLNGISIGLALLAAAVCASPKVRMAAVGLLGGGYRILILPVLEGALWMLLKLIGFLATFLGPLFGRIQPLEAQPVQIDTGRAGFDLDPQELRAFPSWLQNSGYLILIGLAVLLFFYLFRRLSDSAGARTETLFGTVRKSEAEAGPKERTGPELFGGERNVRYYYRKFLKLCAARNIRPKRPLTTEAAHEAAARHWDEERLIELRDLYRSVRYGSAPESGAERKRAAKLYRELKEEKEDVSKVI